MKHLFFSFFILFMVHVSVAQVPVDQDQTVALNAADSGKLCFHFYNVNFFKNNEYFNPLHEGETLPGVIINPAISYQPGSTIKLEAGISLQKFFGQEGFNRVEPVIRLQYQPVAYFQMVMGTLFGGTSHQLIEPLYQWEKTFTHPQEYGLQFLFNTLRLQSDTWLHWKRFIKHNDPFQEELTFGTTFSYRLADLGKSWSITVPFQTVVNHHGGQIITDNAPLLTIGNIAAGMVVDWKPEYRVVRKMNLQCWFTGYRDMSHTKLQPYGSGFGLYPEVAAFLGNFKVQAGYFHGEGWMTSEGEPLFATATIPFNGSMLETRDMATCKIIFQKKIQQGIAIAAYAEIYKDLSATKTDYDYGVHIVFDRSFFLARL